MKAPKHLNGHQRDTLAHAFRHPSGQKIGWNSVLSLFNAVASVEETHKGHIVDTLRNETETFEPRLFDTEQLANRRRLLKAGYRPEQVPA